MIVDMVIIAAFQILTGGSGFLVTSISLIPQGPYSISFSPKRPARQA